jgi:hypothetical protein
MAKEKIYWRGMAGRAVRYADKDRLTPGYSNKFAYQGVSQSARPASAGQCSMRSRQTLFCHLGVLAVCLAPLPFVFIRVYPWFTL